MRLERQITNAPHAIHRGADELPYVPLPDGSEIQLLHVDLTHNEWIANQRFPPGTQLERHLHTGPTMVVTHAGRWRYLEYPEVNVAGSYLFEPAGSMHTFHVPADNDEVTTIWFCIRGSNLILDDDDRIVGIDSATSVYHGYRRQCARLGHPDPAVIVRGAD